MKQETLQLTGGGKQEKRRALDFYPTPPHGTIALMDFLELDPCVIWGPACGDGAMSNIIRKYGHEVLESDIRFGENYFNTFKKADVIITNPPFSLSSEFIEKAIKDTRTVAMLLKSQYWHAKTRIDLFKKHQPAYVLPLTWRLDFLQHERKPGDKKGSPTMEVCWTVWKRGSTQTLYYPLDRPSKNHIHLK